MSWLPTQTQRGLEAQIKELNKTGTCELVYYWYIVVSCGRMKPSHQLILINKFSTAALFTSFLFLQVGWLMSQEVTLPPSSSVVPPCWPVHSLFPLLPGYAAAERPQGRTARAPPPQPVKPNRLRGGGQSGHRLSLRGNQAEVCDKGWLLQVSSLSRKIEIKIIILIVNVII